VGYNSHMTPIAHLSAGYIVYRISELSFSEVPSNAVLGLSILGVFIPDIDGLFGNNMNNHRYTLFHAPLFWLSLVLLSPIFGPTVAVGMRIFSLGLLSHLLLDWVSARTCGVMLFYPFTKKPYSLFPLTPEMGAISTLPNKKQLHFWKFYLKNKFLVMTEGAIIFVGIAFLAAK
jgi:hypothetical protein